jgi:hypothetical protein
MGIDRKALGRCLEGSAAGIAPRTGPRSEHVMQGFFDGLRMTARGDGAAAPAVAQALAACGSLFVGRALL